MLLIFGQGPERQVSLFSQFNTNKINTKTNGFCGLNVFVSKCFLADHSDIMKPYF